MAENIPPSPDPSEDELDEERVDPTERQRRLVARNVVDFGMRDVYEYLGDEPEQGDQAI